MSVGSVPPFKRTVCACVDCRQCCARPGYMVPGDWERIAAFLGMLPDEASHLFGRGKGAIVAHLRGAAGIRLRRIETIAPLTFDGRCVFLTDNGLCAVHSVSPFSCAYFDLHMPKEEGARRSAWGLREILKDESYAERWNALPERTVE